MKRAITITYILDVPSITRLRQEDAINHLIHNGVASLFEKDPRVVVSDGGFSHEPLSNCPVRDAALLASEKLRRVTEKEEEPSVVSAKEVKVDPPKWKEGEFDGNCQ